MSKTRTKGWRLALSVVALALGSTALAVVPAGPVSAEGEAETAAAEQLARDHNLSLTEATARIGRQDRTLALAQEAERALADRFGGVWTDHARAGTIFVGATGALPTGEVDRLAAAHGLSGHVKATTVSYSESHLRTVALRLATQVGEANLGGPDTLEVGLRPDLNRVEIALPKDAALTPDQQRFLDDARRTHGAALIETRTALRTDAQACAFPYCDPSLRGGVGINSANGTSCTAGFMAKKPDGSRWVLTAGHCLYLAGFDPWQSWGTKSADGTARTIGGSVQGWWYGGGHADHAVFRVDKVGVEAPENWVYYKSASPAYDITSASPIPALWGTYLCKTGRTSGRQCGSVVSPSQTVTYSSGVTVTGMVKANIFTCKGDSGGPVYASHKAYGLHSGGSKEFGSCGTKAYSTPIGTATAELGVQVLLA